MKSQNRITEVKLTLDQDDHDGRWIVAVTKEFAPEYGGGQQTFTETAPTMHRAVDTAREMVTLSPGMRTDLQKAAR